MSEGPRLDSTEGSSGAIYSARIILRRLLIAAEPIAHDALNRENPPIGLSELWARPSMSNARSKLPLPLAGSSTPASVTGAPNEGAGADFAAAGR
jgi:hypothetical protein